MSEHLSPSQNIFTVPPGRPFLSALARAILAGDLPRAGGQPPSDLDLPNMTILLPTRRAARALQDAFLDAAGGRALLLPRIRPIAEGDEDLDLISSLSGLAAIDPGDADLPPAIGEIERRLTLTRLVQHWSAAMRRSADSADDTDRRVLAVTAGAGTTAQAANLAAELGRLIDEVDTEGVDLSGIGDLVDPEFSEHWQQTVGFLQIVLAHWPEHLAEQGVLSPMARRNMLVLAEAKRLRTADRMTADRKGPVIVAGVTGSIPATAELMRTVAGLPDGAIVLPGLDLTLDEESWTAIRRPLPEPSHPEHPHYAMSRLVDALGVRRCDVRLLPGAEPSAAVEHRSRIVSEALRPATTTERWHGFAAAADELEIRAALDGVSLIEAPTAEDEAEAVALILRQSLEIPGRTAALVSRDRVLARRVVSRLQSWGIRVDDSAGRPLPKTMPGAFLDLVIEAVACAFSPAAVVALLKHPLTRLGLPAAQVRRAARALELAAFRTLYLGRGLDGIEAALDKARQDCAEGERRERAVRRLWDEDWDGAADLVRRLREAYGPLEAIFGQNEGSDLRSLARAHAASAEALAALPEGDTARGLWANEAGEAASLFFAGIIDEQLTSLEIEPGDYPDLYRGLARDVTVRSRIPLHPRLAIWGPLEARLQQPDVVVIGALNEGTWPEQVDPGAWLNRPMRARLGLPAPEERIGFSAHDFSMLMGASQVYLTRALKVDGVPAVASRWLLRLNALLDALRARDALRPEEPWLAWAGWRNQIQQRRTITPPAPRPPVEVRPRKLSVSAVETWMANPYAIFAREILKLDPLPVLGSEPDAAVRGAIIHAALSAFARRHPDSLPDEAAAALLRYARAELDALSDNPRVAAFWLPRLARFAEWFVATEPYRRAGTQRIATEVIGETVLDGPAGPFKLTARADRIDLKAEGAVIIDYKTAANLTGLRRDAEKGFAPQLALEAAIALAGGFTGVDISRVAGLVYISASGAEPPGAEVRLKTSDTAKLAEDARSGLLRLIADFDRPATPYSALRRAGFVYDYDDYAHLARADEWSAATEVSTDSTGTEGA
jgi:ATP-dependent helicase/nuclease subunit B